METAQPKNKILELINWVDSHERQLFRRRDALFNWKITLLSLALALFMAVEALNFLTSTNIDKVLTLLTLFVIFLAFAAIILQTSDQTVLNKRYQNAVKTGNFSGKDQPLLLALIKIKSRNPQFKLAALYLADNEAGGEFFTQKKLLESIY